MARRVCLFCGKDVGEALPREDWDMYPADIATHVICENPECQIQHRNVVACLHDERPVAGVPVES